MVQQFCVSKPCDVFEAAAGQPRLSEDYLNSFSGREGWSIHLVARRALDLPPWLEWIPGRDPVHLYVSLRDPDGKEITQIHGLPFDRTTGKPSIVGNADDSLRAVFDRRMNKAASVAEYELWRGHATEFAKKVGNAALTAYTINAKDYDYHAYFPFFQSRNSNSIARGIVTSMGLSLPQEVEGKWWDIGRRSEIWAPGVTRGTFNRVAGAPSLFDQVKDIGEAFAKGLSTLVNGLTTGMVSAAVVRTPRAERMAAAHSTPARGLIPVPA